MFFLSFLPLLCNIYFTMFISSYPTYLSCLSLALSLFQKFALAGPSFASIYLFLHGDFFHILYVIDILLGVAGMVTYDTGLGLILEWFYSWTILSRKTRSKV